MTMRTNWTFQICLGLLILGITSESSGALMQDARPAEPGAPAAAHDRPAEAPQERAPKMNNIVTQADRLGVLVQATPLDVASVRQVQEGLRSDIELVLRALSTRAGNQATPSEAPIRVGAGSLEAQGPGASSTHRPAGDPAANRIEPRNVETLLESLRTGPNPGLRDEIPAASPTPPMDLATVPAGWARDRLRAALSSLGEINSLLESGLRTERDRDDLQAHVAAMRSSIRRATTPPAVRP